MFGCFPVECARTAFVFSLHIFVVGILFTDFGQHLSTPPLETDSLNRIFHARIGKNFINQFNAVGIERTQIDLNTGVLFFYGRCQIFHIEADDTFRSPCTCRINRVSPRFVLKHDSGYHNSFFLISRHEFTEKISIRLQIAGILNKIVIDCYLLGIKFLIHIISSFIKSDFCFGWQLVHFRITSHRRIMVNLHPRRRRPRRRPKSHIGIDLFSPPNIGNKGCFVTIDIEIFQLEITRHFITTVPVAGIVIGIHRDTPHRKA